jgi:predicted transcriptional regulator
MFETMESHMSLTQISLDEATLAQLDAVATARSLSREETVREAIKSLTEYELWFRRRVDKGLQDIREGRVLSSEEVDRRAESRRIRLLKSKGMIA